ncbi:hypothetical protein LOK49_LG02G00430 [Camellia lanceoleosa]|uniref:Uncharacterized protein n=1 Tax=Camellia lanceoleosa TaxID=1840588 RepID=A0ACC0ISH2_9ERIC|nr:hypothetical protein LOK49_LG02G00430 [Camellia lanceoleosa]
MFYQLEQPAETEMLLVMSPDCWSINSHDIYDRLTNQSEATISPFLKVPVSVMTLKTHIFHRSYHLTPEELLLEVGNLESKKGQLIEMKIGTSLRMKGI